MKIKHLNYSILILNGIPGDDLNDQTINVIDIVQIINFIFDVQTPNNYQFWASDINADGDLNVLDVVLLVGLILD